MDYLNSMELTQFHEAFLARCASHTNATGLETWGYPGGINTCDTYSFDTQQGTMHIGHDEMLVPNRWWIPAGLESQRNINDLDIAFELNIPRNHNMHVAVHYVLDDEGRVHIFHKGKFTARHGLSMSQFFAYYSHHPGQWPVVRFAGYRYLELGCVSMDIHAGEFAALLDSLAAFAAYIPQYKAQFR